MYMLFHELIISIFYFSEYKIQISVLGELRKIRHSINYVKQLFERKKIFEVKEIIVEGIKGSWDGLELQLHRRKILLYIL